VCQGNPLVPKNVTPKLNCHVSSSKDRREASGHEKRGRCVRSMGVRERGYGWERGSRGVVQQRERRMGEGRGRAGGTLLRRMEGRSLSPRREMPKADAGMWGLGGGFSQRVREAKGSQEPQSNE